MDDDRVPANVSRRRSARPMHPRRLLHLVRSSKGNIPPPCLKNHRCWPISTVRRVQQTVACADTIVGQTLYSRQGRCGRNMMEGGWHECQK